MEVDKLEQNEQYSKQAAVASVHLITWQIIIFLGETWRIIEGGRIIY